MPSFALQRAPVVAIEDVLAVVPTFLRPDDPAPVRDAILAAVLALCLSCQDWAEWASDQASVLAAEGPYLAAAGGELGVQPNGDSDPVYRARILTPPEVVSPNGIVTAVNAVLSPYTSISAKYLEQADMIIARVDGATTGPFAYVYADGTAPRSPDYADRLYASEAAQNGGVGLPYREPGAARAFSDAIGRIFVLRVPDLTSLDAEDTPIFAEPQTTAGFFIGTTALGSWNSYLLENAATSSTLYASVIDAVNRLKGQSVRWILLVDPTLTS